jgi:hypothetical protein
VRFVVFNRSLAAENVGNFNNEIKCVFKSFILNIGRAKCYAKSDVSMQLWTLFFKLPRDSFIMIEISSTTHIFTFFDKCSKFWKKIFKLFQVFNSQFFQTPQMTFSQLKINKKWKKWCCDHFVYNGLCIDYLIYRVYRKQDSLR